MSQDPSPRTLTTAAEAIDYLYELRLFGTKLGLENPLRLAKHFGNPQAELKFIHVAGTNGKGSVCAILESIYRNAGYRVGLFTSPHLIRFGERIQVNRRLLPDDRLVTQVNEIREALRQFNAEHHPTFFEIVVVLGLLHFRQERCDVVIWETGMGGRLDATNIVQPILSVITNVALDHQKWLGDTVEAIAAEKAGIIKAQTPSIHGVMDPRAASVIRQTAASIGSPLTQIQASEGEPFLGELPLSLAGKHQRENAALALRSVELLRELLPVSPAARRIGLKQVRWSGRLQTIQRNKQTLLLDGAHNEPSIQALCEHLTTLEPRRPISILMGVLEDKGIEKWIHRLASLANQFFLVPVASGRTLAPTTLATLIEKGDFKGTVRCFETAKEALEAALKDSTFLVICGSIYLIGETLSLLTAETSSMIEQGLNDWNDTPGKSSI